MKRKRSSKGLQRAQQRLKILFFSRRRIRIPREEVSKDHKEDFTQRYTTETEKTKTKFTFGDAAAETLAYYDVI